MFTLYTRQYKDDKKKWFDLRAIERITDKHVVLERDIDFALDLVRVPEGITMKPDGFVAFPHDYSGLFYVTKEQATDYVVPQR